MNIADKYAADWFTLAPRYRTKARLAEQISAAMREARKAALHQVADALENSKPYEPTNIVEWIRATCQ